MPRTPSASNRGPAAAADNRRAILAAARRVFIRDGYHAPLSAIAREAGVGQGVLYRHFPTRLDLAFTVFEENFTELGRLAADPDADTLGVLWIRLLDLTAEEAAFVEMAVDARRSQPTYDGADRLRALLERPLELARAAGRTDPHLTVDDLLLAQRMAYGIVVTATGTGDARASIDLALAACTRVVRGGDITTTQGQSRRETPPSVA